MPWSHDERHVSVIDVSVTHTQTNKRRAAAASDVDEAYLAMQANSTSSAVSDVMNTFAIILYRRPISNLPAFLLSASRSRLLDNASSYAAQVSSTSPVMSAWYSDGIECLLLIREAYTAVAGLKGQKYGRLKNAGLALHIPPVICFMNFQRLSIK